MVKRGSSPPPEERIINETMSEALSKRYLAYALSTITARALPDVRDGLKPVQRRILYGMRVLKLDPDGGYRKCAKIVGDVMGNYHPHGDSSIYDTLVRLAQDFNVRYPLVDGQGNFGNIDGDSAAAYRYTEARMTRAAELLMEGLDENAVDFRANYAENDEEPVVLPAGFPALLANGATGIAVGMATSIPPHNLGDVIDAIIYMIDRWEKLDDIDVEQLMKFVQGLDFPTGGLIVMENKDENPIESAYGSGRGRIMVRAKAHVEEMERSKNRIIVTELPYMVNKSSLIERIANLARDAELMPQVQMTA